MFVRKYGKLFEKVDGLWLPSYKFNLFDGDGEVEGVEDTGTGAGGQNTPTEGEEQPDGRVAGDTGGSGHMVPKQRLDAVLAQLREYKKYGDPAAIQKAVDRLAWMEANPGKKYSEKELQSIEAELLQVPGLSRAMSAAQRFEQFEAKQSKRFVDYGGRQTDKFLTELGRTPDDKNRAALSHAIAGVIQSDPDLLDRFYGLDTEVYADAFKAFRNQLLGNLPLKRPAIPGADVQRTKVAAKAPAGKAPAKAAQTEPKTDRELLDEAGDAAFEALMDSAER